MPSRNFIVFGAAKKPSVPLRLRAGPVTLFFETETVFLRRICLGSVEVLRGIYAAVRDRNWGTVAPKIEKLRLESSKDAFDLGFGVECKAGEIDFRWRGAIKGTPDGTIIFSFDGSARSAFFRNRIGLCVLHPLAGCVGQPCLVEHTDGSIERGSFPRFISPRQPFKQIRAITHKVATQYRAEVRFAGDAFEMEDQRNWTDASFKTYCTPLELPFPVPVETGTRIRQCVTLRLHNALAERAPRSTLAAPHQPPTPPLPQGEGRGEGEHRVRPTHRVALPFPRPSVPPFPTPALDLALPEEPELRLPAIGLGMASHGQDLTKREVSRLRMLGFPHVRAEIEFSKAGWRETLRRAAREARQLGCSLHLALVVTDTALEEVRVLEVECEAVRAPVALWMVSQDARALISGKSMRLAMRSLAKFGANIPVAIGTNANFAELNRHRPPPGSPAPACFSITPQVHAFDHASLVENLEAQPATVESARQFSPNPVVISPITLRPRFNAVATCETAPEAPSELPSAVDARQMSLFAAAWTLGSIARLSGTGHVHSLTYYETTGWRGVMETETGSSLPDKFPSTPGAVFPLFHVFAAMAGFSRMAPVSNVRSDELAALALFGDRNKRRVLLASLSSNRLTVKLRAQASRARMRILDETNVQRATSEPEKFLAHDGHMIGARSGFVLLSLKPHALACIDFDH